MNSRKKRRTRIIITAMVISLLLLIAGAVGLIYNYTQKDKTVIDIPPKLTVVQTPQEIEQAIEQVKNSAYVSETSYNGKTVMDASLYEIPFQISESYISNKTLFEKQGQSFLDDKQKVASDFIKTLYNINYNYLISDPNKYIDTYVGFYDQYVTFDTGEADVTAKEYAELVVDNYVTNKVQMEAEFITDPSLVFYDGGNIFVRGYIKYTVFSYSNIDELKEELKNSNMEIGTTYYVMAHVRLVTSSDNPNEYKIYGLEIL